MTDYMRRADAANYLGLSSSTLANWASEGKGPVFHKVGRIPLYAVTELRRFVEARTVAPLS